MNCSFELEESTKLIKISADTECYWSIIVQSGNITLQKYYGSLNKDNNFLAQTTIFTYGTSEMNGELLCSFQSNNKIVKKKLLLESIPLDFLYVNEKNLYLFGKDTKTQLYVNYGLATKDDESTLSNIQISINEDTIEYKGTSFSGIIQYKNIDLYEYEISDYDEMGKYFVIMLKSLCDLNFNDSIVINNEYEIKITQTSIENLPTLLNITPCIIFLDSNNPKQKVNVTSMAFGMTANYIIATSTANTQSYNFLQENVTTEEYLNSTLESPTSIANSDTNIIQYIGEKNASHFIIDMGSIEQNMETTGETGYELYVINDKDNTKFQKLEIFYDNIEDPDNYIYITSVKNAYAYIYKDKQGVIQIKKDENDVIDFSDTLSGQSYITLYFTNDIITDDEDIKAKGTDVILTKYDMNKNVIFTIDSKPNWWRIVDTSENVKEVKMSNKELHISLEYEIQDDDHVKIENELGRTCTIALKSEKDILDTKDIFAFQKTIKKDESSENTFYYEPFITIEISGGSIIKIDNQEINENYITLKSQFSEEKVFNFDTIYEKTNNNIIKLPTIFYEKKNNEIKKEIKNHDFEILYNNEIDKYYINYGSFTILPNNSLLDMQDGNKYYFEGNEVIIPSPYSTTYAPFTIADVNNLTYDIYGWNNVDKQYEKINDYLPISSITNIGYSLVAPTNKIENVDIVLVSNTMLIERGYANTITFQQLSTMKEVTLVINLITKQQNNYINKYGNVQDLKQMQLINYPTLLSAAISNGVKINIPQDDEKKMYYASYKKESSFKVIENDDIEFYIIKNAPIKQTNSGDWLNEELSGGGDEKKGDFYNQIYSGTTPNFTELVSGTPMEYENSRYYWNIENGTINLSIKDNNSINVVKSIFPETGITKYYIDINKMNDEDDTQKIIYSTSPTNYGIGGFVVQDNDSPSENKVYYAIKYGKDNKLRLNDINYNIEYDDKEDQYYIIYDCLYRLCDKTITLNNKIYQFDAMNALYDPRTKIKYYAYEEDEKWYFTLPSFEFDIKYDSENKKFYYELQDTKININNNLTHTYNDEKYISSMKVNLSGLTLEVVSNLDGKDRLNKEYFVIINDKKYKAYQNENDEWCIKLNNEKIFNFDTNNLIIEFNEDFYIDLYSEADYEYVIIERIQYKLIDNTLIYDSKEFFPFTWKGQKYVIINKKGYKVYKENEHYYFILNYKKYEYQTYSAETINLLTTTLASTSVLNVDELINQQFHFELQFEDLLSNDIISAKYDDNVVTNGYCEVNGDVYFNSGFKPIEKYIWVDEDESYNIISEEIIKMTKKEQTSSTISLNFNDDTSLTFPNKCNINISIGDQIENKTIEKNERFDVDSGATISLTSDTLTFIINDYSEVIFNNDVFMTFQNNCNIILVTNDGNETYFISKNETFAVSIGTKIIFKDIVKLKIYNQNSDVDLFVFDDIVEIDKQIFIPSVINNQKAIIYNNNTYYIYDGKVIIKKGSENENYETEKCVFYKNVNTNGLSYVKYEIQTFKLELTEIKYGYISNNGETVTPMNSLQDVTTWEISVPSFNDNENILYVGKYELQNIVTYKIQDDVKYHKAEFSGHPNYNAVSIEIENGVFDLNINSYRIYDNNNNVSGHTSSQKKYEITLNNYTHSVWDYFANDYVKKIQIKEYEEKSFPILKKIILNNVKFNVDEKKYFLINDEFVPYTMEKQDENATETTPYVEWEDKKYFIHNDEVIIPQKCKLTLNKSKDGYIIHFDISSYLTHNMIINFYNDDLGHVHYLTAKNVLSLPHTETIIIKTKDMNEENKFSYGKYELSFY